MPDSANHHRCGGKPGWNKTHSGKFPNPVTRPKLSRLGEPAQLQRFPVCGGGERALRAGQGTSSLRLLRPSLPRRRSLTPCRPASATSPCAGSRRFRLRGDVQRASRSGGRPARYLGAPGAGARCRGHGHSHCHAMAAGRGVSRLTAPGASCSPEPALFPTGGLQVGRLVVVGGREPQRPTCLDVEGPAPLVEPVRIPLAA